jgi:hypothetical protein
MKVSSITTPLLSRAEREPRGEEKSDLGGPTMRRQSSVVAGTSMSVSGLLERLQADRLPGDDAVPIPEFEGFRYLTEVDCTELFQC